MLKAAVFAVVITLGQSQTVTVPKAPDASKIPRTAAAQQADKSGKEQQDTQPAVTIHIQKSTEEIKAEAADREKDRAIQQEMSTFNGYLVVLGIISIVLSVIGVAVSFSAAKAAQKAAEASDRSAAAADVSIGLMNQQGEIMAAQRDAATKQSEYMHDGLIETRVAAEAAKVSASTAQQALVTLQRPFVHWLDCRWFRHADPSRPGRYNYSIEPLLQNNGVAPTRDGSIQIGYELSDRALGDDFTFPLGDPWPVFIGPKASVVCARRFIRDDELVSIQLGKKHLYGWGVVTYRGVFDNERPHTTKYCFFVTSVFGDPLRPVESHLEMRFFYHQKHNEAS
jgi:hypothetical protein